MSTAFERRAQTLERMAPNHRSWSMSAGKRKIATGRRRCSYTRREVFITRVRKKVTTKAHRSALERIGRPRCRSIRYGLRKIPETSCVSRRTPMRRTSASPHRIIGRTPTRCTRWCTRCSRDAVRGWRLMYKRSQSSKHAKQTPSSRSRVPSGHQSARYANVAKFNALKKHAIECDTTSGASS